MRILLKQLNSIYECTVLKHDHWLTYKLKIHSKLHE